MFSWISRINLVAALFSSPPFPAAVGSQRRFVRPILPAAPSRHPPVRPPPPPRPPAAGAAVVPAVTPPLPAGQAQQQRCHEEWLQRVARELLEHQRNLPEKRGRARELDEHRLKGEYLLYEVGAPTAASLNRGGDTRGRGGGPVGVAARLRPRLLRGRDVAGGGDSPGGVGLHPYLLGGRGTLWDMGDDTGDIRDSPVVVARLPWEAPMGGRHYRTWEMLGTWGTPGTPGTAPWWRRSLWWSPR